ncbi:uncharacterized protein BDZ83DRAFT_203255 [Colletotrichum acutatum]|uniref:Uncharacterized protein n=1 Tax=Glomerella acutata TaxID=27357 RepID=A0AAD8UN55_GLOAC|nr:uncharacterized protein BDZ83DRAFT_203255 [Colletotrichum acutatum]KAK1727412.1 hypothetical protein BDZ83DRAFT_203255 [Colletotrichum acutatum]
MLSAVSEHFPPACAAHRRSQLWLHRSRTTGPTNGYLLQERQTDEAAQSHVHHNPCNTSMRLFFFFTSSLCFLEYLNLPPVPYSPIITPTLPTPLCITSLVPPTTLPPLPSRPFLPWSVFRPASIVTGWTAFHAMTRLAEQPCLAPLPTNRSHVPCVLSAARHPLKEQICLKSLRTQRTTDGSLRDSLILSPSRLGRCVSIFH